MTGPGLFPDLGPAKGTRGRRRRRRGKSGPSPVEVTGRAARVLAIDPGMTREHPLGWASSVGERVRSGTVTLEGRSRKTRGRRFEYFRDWLEGVVLELGPDVVAIEMPPMAKGGLQGRLSLLGVIVVAEELLSRYGIDAHLVSPASVKKAVTGKGGAGKDLVARCVAAMYPDQAPFAGPDQADALAVLEWARTKVLGMSPRGKDDWR